MGRYEDLKELDELRERGAITDAEYEREKYKILNRPSSSSKDLFGMDVKSYTMIMHLSQFAGYILFGLGFVIPIVLWLINKENPTVDKHGKNIANFMLSWIIYCIIAGVLCFVLIGIPLLILLAILQVVFIIITTIRAYNGEYWKYPMSINFFS